MATMTLDGAQFQSILLSGIAVLDANKDVVNNLNVFPVPDGDTGTNMCMTAGAAVSQNTVASIADMSVADARSMMRAARGNSGVILSLFFRGLAKAFAGHDTADPVLFLEAMHEGARSAAAAVENPVEGTILTVMRECATKIDARGLDFEGLFDLLYKKSEMILERTPEMLPALRRARVVDSGGYGFVRILEGMRAAAMGEEVSLSAVEDRPIKGAADFDMFDDEEIKFSFCTECLVDLDGEVPENVLRDLKAKLGSMGDSMVLTTDEEIFKIHIHTNEPLTVLGMIFPLGTVRASKIENMKLQHTGLVTAAPTEHHEHAEEQPKKKYGIFAVSPGDGFSDLFKELGADAIIAGGQSMNPSANDILKAIEAYPCENAIILPNNSNIILTAKQTAGMCEGTRVIVIPTKTMPQGVSALFAYNESRTPEENLEEMSDSAKTVNSYSVTQAVRDAEIDGITVKKHQYLGLGEGKIITAEDELLSAVTELVAKIEPCDLMTVYYGKGVKEQAAEKMLEEITAAAGDKVGEITLVYGGQPLYPYIISAE